MNEVLYTLFALLFINFIYLFFKFLTAINLGIHDDQLFLGYGKHKAFTIRIKKLTIYFGLFIPLPWLAKFYSYKDGVKGRITYEWEFHEKSPGLRLLLIFSGAIGSLLTSMLIFSVLSFLEKDQYISKEELNKYGVYPSEFAQSAGFQKGDRILSLNGQDYERLDDLISPLALLSELTTYEILRGQDTIFLQPYWNIDRFTEHTSFIFAPNAPTVVAGLLYGETAEEAGMKEGDVLTKIDTIEVISLEEVKDVFRKYAGDTVFIQVIRGEDSQTLTVEVSEEGTIGFYSIPAIDYSFDQKSVPEAIVTGVVKSFDIIGTNLKGVAQLFGAEIETRKSTAGPIRIATLFGGMSVERFFRVSAILLTLFTIWELLPLPKSGVIKSIPLISEAVFKRRMTYESFVKIQNTGWYVFVALMIGTMISDIVSL